MQAGTRLWEIGENMSLTQVDWSLIPAPANDGRADHLTGMTLPDVTLPATDGGDVLLADVTGLTVFYLYPMTGRPDRDLPDGWDDIPGARGCTPQSCAFRDLHAELASLGVSQVYGISTQSTADQTEAATRLKLPYALLSDADGALAAALDLPTQVVAGMTMLKRLTMIVKDGQIAQVFYPVFPPDQDADNVRAWIIANT